MSWTVDDYPFLLGASAKVTQGGELSGVPADASAPGTVTYSFPYVSSVSNIQLTPVETVWNGFQLSWSVTESLLTGFQIIVSGGPPGSTVAMYWSATGQ